MFPLRLARDTDDVTQRDTYITISNWQPSWIHRIRFPDFPKTTSDSHPIDQKVNKDNKRTLKLSYNMTPAVRKLFLFSVKIVMYQIISEKHTCQSLIALATLISLYIDLPLTLICSQITF